MSVAAGAFVLPLLYGVATSYGQQALKPLAPNDVSILFPAPSDQPDLSGFILLSDLKSATTGQELVTPADFADLLNIANGDAGKVAGTSDRIILPPMANDIKAWAVAGIRFDPGAPGLSDAIKAEFGQIPQVRLIAQPLERRGASWHVLDITAHFIFIFARKLPEEDIRCVPKFDPDLTTFGAVLSDVAKLRDDLAAGKFGTPVDTNGLMNVHPGLAGTSGKAFRDALETLLEKHLVPQRLSAAAIMGLARPSSEPWIFVAMQREGLGKPLKAAPSPALNGQQTAQMLDMRTLRRKAAPLAKSNNQSEAMTRCFVGQDQRKGVSTADVFADTLDKVSVVADIVADPEKSHFFNTDCVSCHTETRLLMEKGGTIAGVEPSVLPSHKWNVRNFGWFRTGGVNRPTITRRTATETAEVVDAVNELLKQGQ